MGIFESESEETTMDSLDTINARHRVADYEDERKLRLPILSLRAAMPMAEFGEEIAHRLWNELCRQGGCENLEAHRYPSLAHDLETALLQRVEECQSMTGPECGDAWAQTGGGAPTRAQRSAVCKDHEQRLIAYTGALLQDLLNAIEKTARDFLSRHAPPFNSPLTQESNERIQRAMEKAVKPWLVENLASPCCDSCEPSRAANNRRRL
jgi:hypothetical protein